MATCSSILARKFHGQRKPAGYSPWGHRELDTTEHAAHTVGKQLGHLPICSLTALGPAGSGRPQPRSAWASPRRLSVLLVGRLPPEQVTQEKPGRSCNTFYDFTSENTQCHAIAPQSHRAVSIQCGRGSHKTGTARGPSWRLALATGLIQEQDIESNSPRINPFQSI